MKNKVYYEWTEELIDPYGDIIDSDFAETIKKLPSCTPANNHKVRIGLVRNSGNEVTGLGDRLWAYIKDDRLPQCFSNAADEITGYNIPARFHKEVKDFLK